MEKQSFPKGNVAAHWMSDSGLFCVQVVEIAENEVQQLTGGIFAVKVTFRDPNDDATISVMLPDNVAAEVAELVDKATEACTQLNGR